jgi:hypothetical protein
MHHEHMQTLVQEELLHLPRGSEAQNELRMVYVIERQHDLGRDPSAQAGGSFDRALSSVLQRHPAFQPEVLPSVGGWPVR